MTPEERQARLDLAAAYRAVAMYGWDDLVFTHISARVPGPEHHFLINPYGMLFEEITASSLVKIDLGGNKVDKSPYDINPAGITVHSAVHEAREAPQSVLHLHTHDILAISCHKRGLHSPWPNSPFPLTMPATHDIEGVTLHPAREE